MGNELEIKIHYKQYSEQVMFTQSVFRNTVRVGLYAPGNSMFKCLALPNEETYLIDISFS